MNQRHLERAIARATGESISTIRRFGFSSAGAVILPGTRTTRRSRKRRERHRAPAN